MADERDDQRQEPKTQDTDPDPAQQGQVGERDAPPNVIREERGGPEGDDDGGDGGDDDDSLVGAGRQSER
jgi:hypothetical protein